MPGSRCPSFMVDNYNSWQWKSLVVVFLPLDSPDLLFLEYSQCINTHKKNVYIFFLKNPDWHVRKEKLLEQNLWVNDSRLFYKRLSVRMCVFCMDGCTQCVWWPVTMVAQSHRISSKRVRGAKEGENGGEWREKKGNGMAIVGRRDWEASTVEKGLRQRLLTKHYMVGTRVLHMRLQRHWSSLRCNSRV